MSISHMEQSGEIKFMTMFIECPGTCLMYFITIIYQKICCWSQKLYLSKLNSMTQSQGLKLDKKICLIKN